MHHRAGESHRGFVRTERKVSPQFLLLLSPSHTSDLCLRLLLHSIPPLTSCSSGNFPFYSLCDQVANSNLFSFGVLLTWTQSFLLPRESDMIPGIALGQTSAAQMTSRLYSGIQPVGRDTFGEVQMAISWGLQSGISVPCIYICEYPITNFVSFNLQCV